MLWLLRVREAGRLINFVTYYIFRTCNNTSTPRPPLILLTLNIVQYNYEMGMH